MEGSNLHHRYGLSFACSATNMIVAEHDPAPHIGATIAAPEHVAALWRLALAQAETPPPNWQIHFDQPVAAAPLSAYQDVCQEACR